jgi:hypothetical protein
MAVNVSAVVMIRRLVDVGIAAKAIGGNVA